jgi:hypothetical protein
VTGLWVYTQAREAVYASAGSGSSAELVEEESLAGRLRIVLDMLRE